MVSIQNGLQLVTAEITNDALIDASIPEGTELFNSQGQKVSRECLIDGERYTVMPKPCQKGSPA